MKKMPKEQREEWFEAVKNIDIDTIKKMLEDGFDVNYKNPYGWTTLHYACYQEQIKLAKFLIENGADITPIDKFGKTPFDELKKKNPKTHKELIQWLAEEHPEKILKIMAFDNTQGKGLGL